ncbi:UDP-glucoronosyl and UDP-glucosyl transferase domain-containing protein [Sarocladium implicatum]|nr:UDP-glucoronosyl and UDP-glucosyl transferase domain-containing protein [Sarocladium implicatum]
MMADLDHPPRRILLLVTGGGYTHAAPVIQLGATLDARGHEIHFATNTSQLHWSPSFTTLSHDLGPGIASEDAEHHYARMRDWLPSHGMQPMLLSKRLFDSLWPETYRRLKIICADEETRPDFIVADFFADAAARDMLREMDVPMAVVWPQMPALMAPASYIPGQPGFQVDAATLTSENASLVSRFRNEFVLVRALPSLLSWFRWTKRMRRAAGVKHDLPPQTKPDYLVLVNSFFGLEVPRDLPPLIAPVGPILSDHYPPLTPDFSAFLASHDRTLFVSLGTHILLTPESLHLLLSALLSALDANLLNGIIWSLPKRAIAAFDTSLSYPRSDGSLTTATSILDDLDPQVFIVPFAPQRALLDHPHTVLFLTHGGGSSANETLYHGCPVLSIGYFFDQLANSARLAAAGVGLSLDKASFTPRDIVSAIDEILTDRTGSYARNVLRMRRIARVAARRGKHRAADLIEEVMYDHELRFADSSSSHHPIAVRPMHLQTADARMSLWRSRNYDMWFVGLTSLGILGVGCWYAAKWWSGCGWKYWYRAVSYGRDVTNTLLGAAMEQKGRLMGVIESSSFLSRSSLV